MHLTRSITFIIGLLLTITVIQGQSTSVSKSKNMKDYTKYLVNIIRIDNEYARFLSDIKIYPPTDDKRMNALYDELFSLNAYVSDVVQVYMKYYTFEEILELIKFYSSPLGKKLIQMNNGLNKQMADLMFTKISDYIFTAAEYGFIVPLP